MEPDQQLRNLRDFLLVYNRMTEICFQRCSSNFNYRSLTMDEEHCVDSCAGKLIRSNHRLMGTYVQLMPTIVQRRMEELESKAAEVAKAEAAGLAGPAAAAGDFTGPSQFTSPATIPAPEVPKATEGITDSMAAPMSSLSPEVLSMQQKLVSDVALVSAGSSVHIPAVEPSASEVVGHSIPGITAPMSGLASRLAKSKSS
ncbi:mitochondrial import inner membrane translocase subunit Tim10 B [Denticeps clupeoides]|uniref:Mitochondrial import inner membrane translocase subunit Tim10 B n=1 Tax=Denticeps clupeoides TaxID=299321 RepID=A0AAY4AAJ6_9TELE|nr:mitochondrial import inner membrane translocase subunit Tim10 B [Denticeps clupeoides]